MSKHNIAEKVEDYLFGVADAFDNIKRLGSDFDEPEGSRYIIVSDSMANKLSHDLRNCAHGVCKTRKLKKEESVSKMYSEGIKIGSCSPVEIHFPDIKFDKEAALNVLRKITHKHKTGNELRVLQDAEFEVVEPLQIEDKGGECENNKTE